MIEERIKEHPEARPRKDFPILYAARTSFRIPECSQERATERQDCEPKALVLLEVLSRLG